MSVTLELRGKSPGAIISGGCVGISVGLDDLDRSGERKVNYLI